MVTWLWVATHEDYSIFPMAFSGSCLDIKMLSDDCLQLWGQCSYCFHMHNILKRLKAQQVQQSPVCPQNRKFKE
ncbi:hypothetical protein K5549_002823 [Capra hircus]|uniref:Anaphase-promoting complex subunit 11 RING-H2 finger domain-containing protein n=1 Tax=Capra hircus TaxID=9925 RepID=A0A8C2N7A2_CAPHI|nr:hypothetical protein K5549_002823 [Capra hircus]